PLDGVDRPDGLHRGDCVPPCGPAAGGLNLPGKTERAGSVSDGQDKGPSLTLPARSVGHAGSSPLPPPPPRPRPGTLEGAAGRFRLRARGGPNMLNLLDPRTPRAKCDGSSRREFLQLGALALGGLTLPDLLRARAEAAAAGRTAPNTSVILLFL